MLAISILIGILGTIGNLIVLWLFCCRIKMMRLTLYFLNMTVANLLMIFCNFTVIISYFTRMQLSLKFQRVMQILYICGFDTNYYFLTAVTAARYLTVTSPAWYQQHRPTHLSAAMCTFLWGLSCVVSFVNYYACFPRYDVRPDILLINCKVANILEAIIEMIFFFPTMLFFTLAIWIRLHKRNQQLQLERVDITIVALVLLFAIVNLPVRIANIVAAWVSRVDRHMLGKITLLMDSFHSASTPFVYIIVGCSNRQKSSESILMFLETALKDEWCIAAKTEAGQAGQA